VSKAAYEIRVAGQVAPRLLEDFERVLMAADPVGTTISAEFSDAAELHGFLDALRREGLVLVDVRLEHAHQPSDAAHPPTESAARADGDPGT
jgi:hypothetical protein